MVVDVHRDLRSLHRRRRQRVVMARGALIEPQYTDVMSGILLGAVPTHTLQPAETELQRAANMRGDQAGQSSGQSRHQLHALARKSFNHVLPFHWAEWASGACFRSPAACAPAACRVCAVSLADGALAFPAVELVPALPRADSGSGWGPAQAPPAHRSPQVFSFHVVIFADCDPATQPIIGLRGVKITLTQQSPPDDRSTRDARSALGPRPAASAAGSLAVLGARSWSAPCSGPSSPPRSPPCSGRRRGAARQPG